MDINGQDQPEKDFEETSTEQFVHPDSPDSNDIFGEPELLPRIGDEHQVAIPDMLTPSKQLKYLSNPCDSHPMVDVSHKFLLGTPVPVTWVHNEAKAIKDEVIEVHGNVDSSRIESKQCVTECSSASDKKEPNLKEDYVNQKYGTDTYGAAPGLPSDTWSEFEVECFLLGLYFFGKDLLQVKRFMEGKEMGQILSFYYGKFFKSAKYQRWADCRKMKGRKCIIGQRLLTGSRQHELFSRLLPCLSEESKNTLVEAYKAFLDGRTSLEEYVSALKRMVGIRVLVEAVGIGKVNEDLTAVITDTSRTNHILTSRPEMPSGKACSSLTCEEIIEYLTGDFRLSKARSNDLFWEAVWPRLLAKGWHSEKPKDDSYRGSKNCLVFLVPGIKKFRRKLLKGDHYFDSVSDVLKKVASEPELLVLETEQNGARSSKKENGCGTEPSSDEDGVSDHEHNRYLKPRFASEPASHMKFTIVDTSLLHEDEPSKVRELRSLPVKMETSSSLVRRPREAEICLPANKVGDPETATDVSDKLKDLFAYSHSKGQSGGDGHKRMAHNNFDLPQKAVKNRQDHHNAHTSTDKQSRSVKPNAEHQLTYSQSARVDPVVKRRRLTACSKAETKFMVARIPKPSVVRLDNCVLSLPAPSKKVARRSHSHAQTQNRTSPAWSLVADSHGEKTHKGEPIQGSYSSATSSESHVRSHPSIDLNVPQGPAEPEVNGQVMKVKFEEDNDLSENCSNNMITHLESSEVVRSATDAVCSDEQTNGNARRQSTRNRPMSTKALEALESSLFNPKPGKKRSQADAQDEKPRASRRSRTKSSMPGNCTVDAARESEAMSSDGIRNTVNDVLSDFLT